MILVSSVIVASLLSMCILRVKYSVHHFIAILLSSLGIFVTVFNDLHDKEGNFSFGNATGDLVALASGILDGVGAVTNEYLLRNGSNFIALSAYQGAFGSVFSLLAIACLGNVSALFTYSWPPSIFIYYLGYVACGFALYSANIYLIKVSSATMNQLVLLSSTLFAMLYDTTLFNRPFVSLLYLEISDGHRLPPDFGWVFHF